MTASRSTISFTLSNWQKLANSENKSKTVNAALSFFFASKDLLKSKEEEFILNELSHYDDSKESYSFDETFK